MKLTRLIAFMIVCLDPRVFAMDGVMQRKPDAVAAKPADDLICGDKLGKSFC